jgi:hypothetical protein
VVVYLKIGLTLRAGLAWLISFAAIVFMIHFPSIQEKNSLSVHDKNPNNVNTWAERKYLQVMQGKKELVSWDDVTQYKNQNGEHALPKTYFEAIFKDPILTVKTFFRLMYYTQLPFLRQLGLFYIITLFIFGYQILKKSVFSNQLWSLMVFYFSFSCIIGLMIVGMVEFRWYTAFTFAISVFGISEFVKIYSRHPLIEPLFYINLVLLSIPSILLIGIW